MTVAWRKSLVVATTAVTAAAVGGCQRSEAVPPPITAVLHVLNTRPVVEAAVVNGRGEAHEVRLLIDTRASGVVLTAAAAKRSEVRAAKRTRIAGEPYALADVEAVRIGDTRLEFADADLLVEIGSGDESLRGVDGRIGADVLAHYGRVTLNFTAGELILGEPADAPVLGTRVPTRYRDGVFTGRVTLGSTTHRLVLDTSAVTTHIRERVPIRITGTRQGVWGPVVLSPFEVVSDPALKTAGEGFLGGNLLARYTLRLDYRRETVRIATT